MNVSFPLKSIVAVTFAMCAVMPLMAQQKPTTSTASSITIDQPWEYIVVTYGKTLFGSPQKTLAYRSIGLASGGQEAPDLENSLDILGRFGWEVVTIVGSIGGDQEIVLKRKYNKALASNEYKAILKGKDLYIKDLIDVMEREQRLRDEESKSQEIEKGKPQLVELDAAESRAKRLAREADLIKIYQDAFQASEFAKFSTATVAYSGGTVQVRITSDVTKNLLTNGNNYRKSEVDAFINPTLQNFRFHSTSLAKEDDVSISVNAVIQFNGTPMPVGVYSTNWSSILNYWR